MSERLGFTFYPKDWWSSDSYFELTAFQRYIYLECLFVMYSNDGYLKIHKPNFENRIRQNISDEDWKIVTSKFENTEFGLTHLSVNKRLRKTLANRENGKKGGRPREDGEKPKKPRKKPTQNPPSEREREREEEKKDIIKNNINVIDFVKLRDFFNSITGKKTKVVTKKAKEQINARLKEGFIKEDIASAIKNCFADEYHISTGHKFLTLEFITRADKLDKYSSIKKDAPKLIEQPTHLKRDKF